MEINKSFILTTIGIIILSLLFFIFIEFNTKVLLTHIIIDSFLIYFLYKMLERQNLLKQKLTKSLIVVAILGYGAFISMVIGFPLIIYAASNKIPSLILTAGILIAIAFLGLLLMFIFLLFITNRKAFKVYIFSIMTGILLNIIILILGRLTDSVTLFILFIISSIVLVILMYVLVPILATTMKKIK